MKQMAENDILESGQPAGNGQKPSNVKELPEPCLGAGPKEASNQTTDNVPHTNSDSGILHSSGYGSVERRRMKPSARYERFGETIRYLTLDEWQQLLDSIDDYRHKLMIRLIYHLGCRVGEFVRIQLKHLDFGRSSVFIPAENTKTGHRRSSHVPVGLMNEIKSMLKREDRMLKRSDAVLNPDEYLFKKSKSSHRRFASSAMRNIAGRYTENRVRQIFQRYVHKAGLSREYGTDSKGRKLHQITVHSLRHSHIMHHIHVYKLPLPIVQKQVGHRTLKATSVYLNPSDEAVGDAYEEGNSSMSI